MNIYGVGSSRPIQKLGPTVQREIPSGTPEQLPLTDRLELSGLSHMAKSLKDNGIRADKVAEIKSQIEAGRYDDDAKLDASLDKLLDDMGL